MPSMTLGRRRSEPAHNGTVVVFGTFDEELHPRVKVLREGLEDLEVPVKVINRPLGLSTADKVRLARHPALVIPLILRLVLRWTQLVLDSRGTDPGMVIVGYMGHFDVHLARLRYRSSVVVLDHLTGLEETAQDRRVDQGIKRRVFRQLDRWALARADLVLCDTEEQAAQIREPAAEVITLPVGASASWHEAGRTAAPPTGPLKVVFVGLFTPLQGTDVIAEAAVEALDSAEVEFTFVGTGQDLELAKSIAGSNHGITWREWIPAGELPQFVASFDVSLGIFGSTPKALRVVPNKVYQGLAAGTVCVTSDTSPQRRLAQMCDPNDVRLVPTRNPGALARQLIELAESRDKLRRDRGTGPAAPQLSPARIAAPLVSHLPA